MARRQNKPIFVSLDFTISSSHPSQVIQAKPRGKISLRFVGSPYVLTGLGPESLLGLEREKRNLATESRPELFPVEI